MNDFFVCFSPQDAWLHQAIATVVGLVLAFGAYVVAHLFVIGPLLHAMGGDKTGDN